MTASRSDERDDGLLDRWTDVFRADTFVHLAIMASIVAGAFQGWLKDRIPGFGPYLLGDLLLLAAFTWWMAGLALRRVAVVGPGRAPAIIFVVLSIPTMYFLFPGTPLVIEVAGLRAWTAFPVVGLIALSIVRTPGQVRAYVGVILALSIVTAVYGIVQYRAGPEAALGASGLAELRHGTTVFYEIVGTGQREFRAFSTFTFPAPFAAMMVYGIMLSAGIAASRHATPAARLLAVLMIALFFIGMTVSGTRAALVSLAAGMIVLGRYRGLSAGQLLWGGALLVSLHFGTLLTSGRIVERFQSIVATEGLLWNYVLAPLSIAGRALMEHPFGLGLGRSGVGVPYFLVGAQPRGFFIGSDGDVGRAAVEMGIFGIALLLVLIFGILPTAARAVRSLCRGTSDDLAFGAGGLIVATVVVILIGSPLSSAPHGVIWWFLLGAVLKVSMMEDQLREVPR